MKEHHTIVRTWLRIGRVVLLLGVFLLAAVLSLAASAETPDPPPRQGPIVLGPWLGTQTEQLEGQEVQGQAATSDGSGEMITATGAWSGWDKGGTFSMSRKLTFSIYGGPVTGYEHYRASIVDWVVPEDGGQGAWQVVGSVYINFDLSATYPGGLSGNFTGTSLTGSGHGTYHGAPFTLGVSGDWQGHVENSSGTIDGSISFSVSGGPAAITYWPPGWDLDLSFQPVPEVDHILVFADPELVGVVAPGDYSTRIEAWPISPDGSTIPGRRLNMSLAPSAVPAELGSQLVTTSGIGVGYDTLTVHVADLAELPLVIPVSVSDVLNPAKQGATDAEFRPSVLETFISDITPGTYLGSEDWEANSEMLTVFGHVNCDDPSKVQLRVRMDTTGDYGLSTLPPIDSAGNFSFPVDVVTPDEWYRVSVIATDEDENTHTASVNIHYLGVSELAIVEVRAPDRVEPGDTYQVVVVVRYSVPEETQLTVNVEQLSLEQSPASSLTRAAAPMQSSTTYTLQPGMNQTIESEHTRQAPVEEGTIIEETEAWFDTGARARSSPIPIANAKADLGNKCWVDVHLPELGDIPLFREPNPGWHHEYVTVGRENLMAFWCYDWTDPEWLQREGLRTEIRFVASGNVPFDIVYAELKIPFFRPTSTWALDVPISLTPGHWAVESKWLHDLGKGFQQPLGRYEAYVEYTVEYEVDGQTKTADFTCDLDTFSVKELCCKSFLHQVLEETKRSGDSCSVYQHETAGQGDIWSVQSDDFGSTNHHEMEGQGDMWGGEFEVSSDMAGNPLRITLDWQGDADLDLHMFDPDMHLLGNDYSGGVRNTIPRAIYSGPDVKPEWVEMEEMIQGTYLVNAYVRESDGPVSATLSFNSGATGLYFPLLLTERLPTPTSTPTSTATPTRTPTRTPTAGWVTIMSEDFEGEFPLTGWRVFDADGTTNGEYHWAATNYISHSGQYSAWPAAGGADGIDPEAYYYPNNVRSWMIYGPFDLSDASSGELGFSLHIRSELDYDSLSWLASTDGNHFYGRRTSGDSGGWQEETLDLTDVPNLGNLAGQPQAWIAFYFQSDDSVVDGGPFVDDIVLRKYVAAARAAAIPTLSQTVVPSALPLVLEQP
jgi:hypothetical protein